MMHTYIHTYIHTYSIINETRGSSWPTSPELNRLPDGRRRQLDMLRGIRKISHQPTEVRFRQKDIYHIHTYIHTLVIIATYILQCGVLEHTYIHIQFFKFSYINIARSKF